MKYNIMVKETITSKISENKKTIRNLFKLKEINDNNSDLESEFKKVIFDYTQKNNLNFEDYLNTSNIINDESVTLFDEPNKSDKGETILYFDMNKFNYFITFEIHPVIEKFPIVLTVDSELLEIKGFLNSEYKNLYSEVFVCNNEEDLIKVYEKILKIKSEHLIENSMNETYNYELEDLLYFNNLTFRYKMNLNDNPFELEKLEIYFKVKILTLQEYTEMNL